MGCSGGGFHQQLIVASRRRELRRDGITWGLHGYHLPAGVPGIPGQELWLREGFPGGLFPSLGSWAASFQEAGMGKSRRDLLRLQDAKIRAAKSQPEGWVDKPAQEAQWP